MLLVKRFLERGQSDTLQYYGEIIHRKYRDLREIIIQADPTSTNGWQMKGSDIQCVMQQRGSVVLIQRALSNEKMLLIVESDAKAKRSAWTLSLADPDFPILEDELSHYGVTSSLTVDDLIALFKNLVDPYLQQL